MGLFKAKEKNVDYYETEATLPEFSIDTNGFIMFNNRQLGGAAVLEVIPHVTTEGMTHEDPVFHNDSTDFEENPNYEPATGALFPDARFRVYPAWTWFLNSLLPHGLEDECTHIQILIKKCHANEWTTITDYAQYTAHKELDHQVKLSGRVTRHQKLIATRTADYLKLIESFKKEVDELPPNMFDIRKLPAYKVKFYMIISYTPSSEGWWMDGRDSDYYVTNTSSPLSLFKEDKSVDKAVGILSRFRKDDSIYDVGGQADDFFWIDTDRTAQILDTRLKKVLGAVNQWNKREPSRPMPFHFNVLKGREVAALIRFFPNILTPYWDKIWTLHANQDDVLVNIEARRAIDIGDTSFIENRDQLERDITRGTVDMRHTQQQQDEFLSRFREMDYDDVGNLQSDYDERFWSPEIEEKRREMEEQRALAVNEDHDLWGDIDNTFAIADEYKTPEQKREEFLQKYRNRSGGSSLPKDSSGNE